MRKDSEWADYVGNEILMGNRLNFPILKAFNIFP